MEQKATLGVLAVIFFMSILFFPQGSNNWKGIFLIGIVFGVLWFFKK